MITGGAGFIGSHLAERLLKKGHTVLIVDNFSTGTLANIRPLLNNPALAVLNEDLKRAAKIESAVEECETIFHLSANPEVRIGESNPVVHFEENILTTLNLLEAIRQTEASKTIVFTSTSTVYGEASQIPTPEDYSPLIPISTYGASKLACEALIAAYCHTFDHRALVLRLANTVGSRARHGIIVDFIRKIQKNPYQLEILGDGNQEKSYLHISDCVEAIVQLTEGFQENTKRLDIFNIGSSDQITTREIADVVAGEMHFPHIKREFTGGVDGGRGWRGDVKRMLLLTDKLRQTGWRPKLTSREAVALAAEALVRELTTVALD